MSVEVDAVVAAAEATCAQGYAEADPHRLGRSLLTTLRSYGLVNVPTADRRQPDRAAEPSSSTARHRRLLTVPSRRTGHAGDGRCRVLRLATGDLQMLALAGRRRAWRLHMRRLSQALMAECYEYAYGTAPSSDLALFGPQHVTDPTIEKLVLSLASLDDDRNVLAPIFADSVGLALATRLIGLSRGTRSSQTRKRTTGLGK
jgi:hypothetical protein